MLALVSGAVLSACSPSASTAVPPVEVTNLPAAAAMLPMAAQAVASPPAAAAPVEPMVTGLPDFTRLVEVYGPAVVNVRVKEKAQPAARMQRSPFEDLLPGFPGLEIDPRNSQPRRGEGSGFIVSSDGYILTNAHVVADTVEVMVTLSDRRELEAKVVGFDRRTDVAVIKVDATGLPTVRIGDPSRLKPGQWVVAIGSPFGMQNSVTAGIVSATSRDLPQDNYVPFIQTDAAVNPGNSGGPLFNLQGEVIGINSQIYSQSGSYEGLSFAIPIDIADNVRDQLVATGKVTRSKIGLQFEPLGASMAAAFNLERPRGALVVDVEREGPADKAGIRPGDVILSVNGRPVESNSSLPAMISVLKPGSSTELEIWRDSKLRKVVAKVVEMQEEGAAEAPRVLGSRRGGGSATPAEPAVLGLGVRPLTAQERGAIDTQGSLVIEQVSGPAEEKGLLPGDIILSVGGTDVKNVAELQAAIKSAPRVVALRIQRGDRISYADIRKPAE
ncbi:MAG TPA: Do family serine endopeptidase [Steroidobacteraceae bacterium]|nr:Do family serine endopeptidase [Steroidobacteraceae bacterium]